MSSFSKLRTCAMFCCVSGFAVLLALGGSREAAAGTGDAIPVGGENQEIQMETGSSPEDSQNAAETQTGKDELVALVQVLDGAYQNALTHDTARPMSESEDSQLERASIRLSSRILSELATGPCLPSRSSESEDSEDEDRRLNCVLGEGSLGLRQLTDLLSNAAGRLQRIGSSTLSGGSAGLQVARIKSMEHLYRMTFSLSKAYFDPPQRGVYLAAAREQLGLARKQMRREHDLCRCNVAEFNERLSELADVDERLKRSD